VQFERPRKRRSCGRRVAQGHRHGSDIRRAENSSRGVNRSLSVRFLRQGNTRYNKCPG
jgi:hypothetical protein